MSYRGPNLRGAAATVNVNGRDCRVEVVTHIRNDRWLVTGPSLPGRCIRDDGSRRMTVHRSDLVLAATDRQGGCVDGE